MVTTHSGQNLTAGRLSSITFHEQDIELYESLEKTKAISRTGIDLNRLKTATVDELPRLVLFGCSHNNAMRGAALRQLKALSVHDGSLLHREDQQRLATLEKTLRFFDHQTSRYAHVIKASAVVSSALTPVLIASVIGRLSEYHETSRQSALSSGCVTVASTGEAAGDLGDVAKIIGNLLYVLSNAETSGQLVNGELAKADVDLLIDSCFDQFVSKEKDYVFVLAGMGKASAKAVNQVLLETESKELMRYALEALARIGMQKRRVGMLDEAINQRKLTQIEKSLVNAPMDMKNKVYLSRYDLADLIAFGQMVHQFDQKGDLSAFNLFSTEQLAEAAGASDSVFARAMATVGASPIITVDETAFSEVLRQLNHRAAGLMSVMGTTQTPRAEGALRQAETLLHKCCQALAGHPPEVVNKLIPLIKGVAMNTANINFRSGAGSSPLHDLLNGVKDTLVLCDLTNDSGRNEARNQALEACEDIIRFFIARGADWHQKSQVFSPAHFGVREGPSAKQMLRECSPTLYEKFFQARAA